jgi:hypothetical protein
LSQARWHEHRKELPWRFRYSRSINSKKRQSSTSFIPVKLKSSKATDVHAILLGSINEFSIIKK